MNQRTTSPNNGVPASPPGPPGGVPPKGAPGVLSRMRSEEVSFAHPFKLKGWAAALPAGTYMVETEEELIQELSFLAYRRVSTTLMAAAARRGAQVGATEVDPRALAEAKRVDTATAEAMSAATTILPTAFGTTLPKEPRPLPAGTARA